MAADTVQVLCDDVRVEGGFDATEPQCLRWLNRAWRRMVSEARAYRKVVAVGNTVAGTAFYAFPAGTVEVYSFELGGVPYGKARRADIYPASQNQLIWSGPSGSGLIVSSANASGVPGVELIPVPSSVLALTAFAAMIPNDLTIDATGDALLAAVLGGDFHDELVAGAVATGLKRLERRADEATPFERDFAGGTERLRLRTRRRFRGPGPAQIRQVGVNA